MKTRFLTLIMIMAAFGITAQSSSFNTGVTYRNGIAYRNNGNNSNFTQDFEGSPYIEDSFVKGKIISENGENVREAYMRFNYVNNLVEIKLDQNQEKSSFIPRVQGIEYNFGDYSYVLKSVDDIKNKKKLDIYYIEYYNNETDKIKFIAYPELEISESSSLPTGYEKSKPNLIRPNLKYFVQNGEKLISVKLKEKDFKEIFSDKEKMNKYFKDNKIKDEGDVIAMLGYYSK